MSRVDAPIMLLFFNRPDVLKELFEWVRKVKPKQLFLVQDGPRDGNAQDIEKIIACREVVEHIDWDCEVKRNYSLVNLTCDEREYSGIDWCFQYVDRLIILEDDCLPSVSFYHFCTELLEKYKNDNRIHIISGFNRCNCYENTPYDYIFSKTGAGLGWATWKRVWEQVKRTEKPLFNTDEELEYYNSIVENLNPKVYRNMIKALVTAKEKDFAAQKVHSWEILVGAATMLNSSLTITPSKNLVKYNGITEDATHCHSDVMLLTSKVRKMLTQCAYEIEIPIKHPPYIVRDIKFEELDRKIYFQKNKFLLKCELFFNLVRARKFSLLLNAIKKRIIKNNKD